MDGGGRVVLCDAGHQEAEALGRCCGYGHIGQNAPVVDHGNAVGQFEQFFHNPAAAGLEGRRRWRCCRRRWPKPGAWPIALLCARRCRCAWGFLPFLEMPKVGKPFFELRTVVCRNLAWAATRRAFAGRLGDAAATARDMIHSLRNLYSPPNTLPDSLSHPISINR